MADPNSLLAEALQAIKDSSDEKTLESSRVRYLGKKGALTALLKSLGQLPAEDRPSAGERINIAKQEVRKTREARKSS